MTDSAEKQVWIRAAQGADELRSLHEWLRQDDALRGRTRAVHERGEPGQMGGVLDALVVAVGSGGMGAVLAGALSTWISQRRSDVKLVVTDKDGRKIELDAKRVDPQAVLREIATMLDGPEPPR